jgi:Arc/MetJ family transcription regulator
MGYSPRSKRDAVELGLRTLVRLQQQGDLEAPTRSRTTGWAMPFHSSWV